jgi:hypothetical protein
MISYKDRTVDFSKYVDVYRCLNRSGKTYSIRQDGKVVAHTEKLILKKCEFIINKSGKQRCIETGDRNVHAFIRGYIGNGDDVPLSFGFHIHYNPFDERVFFSNNFEIKEANAVHIRQGGIFAYI